ncbi:MAG: shikimate kinase [Minisyncoccota bacterium]
MKNIFNAITLIGMPASGKSTIGKILAKKLGWGFVDLDDLIKEKTGKSYDKILEQEGEKKLLELENKFTQKVNFKDSKGIIFSPGGSIIYSPNAIEKIKNETRVIHIETPFYEIKKRLKERVIKGGIVGLKEKGLKKLFEERNLVYIKIADNTIRFDNLSEAETASKVLKLISKN